MTGPTALAIDEETLNEIRREAERMHKSPAEVVRDLTALRRSAQAFNLPIQFTEPNGARSGGPLGGMDLKSYLDNAMQMALLKGLGLFQNQTPPPPAPPAQQTIVDTLAPMIKFQTEIQLVRSLPKLLGTEGEENAPLRKLVEERTKALEAQLMQSLEGNKELGKQFEDYVNETEKAELKKDAAREKAELERELRAREERLAAIESEIASLRESRSAPPPSLGTQFRELASQAAEIQQGAAALRDLFPHPKTTGEEDNSGFGKAMKVLDGINNAAASFAETYGKMQGNRAAGAYAGGPPPAQGTPPQGIPPGTLPSNYQPAPPPQAAPRPSPPPPPRAPPGGDVYVDPVNDEIITKAEYEARYPSAPAEPSIPPGALGEAPPPAEEEAPPE